MTENAATVSFVIAARNVGEVLATALNSLLRQTRTDWEAIIVDDRSTDETQRLASGYQERDSRFRVIDGPGRGVSAARNAGINAATSPWLVFLDADDWIAPSHLETLLGALAAAPDAQAAFCQYQRVAADGTLLPPRWHPEVADRPFAVFARRCAVAIHAVVVSRPLVAALGGFDETLKTCEDWDLWQRVARAGAGFVGVEQCLAFYRISTGSLSGNSAQLLQDAIRVINCGFGRDPRVANPAPGNAAGADAETGEAAQWATYVAIWCAARDAAAGRDSSSLFAILPEIPDLHVHLWTAAWTIIDAAMIGAGLPLRGLAGIWLKIKEPLANTLRILGDAAPLSGLQTRLEYATERALLRASELTQPLRVGRMIGMRIDIRRLESLSFPTEVDTLYLYLCDGSDILLAAELPVFERLPLEELVALAVEKLTLTVYLKRSGMDRRPQFLCRFAWHALPHLPRLLLRAAGRRAAGANIPPRAQLWDAAFKAAIGTALGGRSAIPDAALQPLIEAARRGAPDRQTSAAIPLSSATDQGRTVADLSSKPYWESLFEKKVDPWNYGSRYQQIKYERTLSLIPEQPIRNALELACAEGHFTQQLAGRVERLTATDISERALARASERCAAFDNVTFRPLDLAGDPLPRDLDLIVCSEVLYYLKDEAELRAVAARLAAALSPGGRIVTAHPYLLKEDLSRTAFDWNLPYGAATIARVLEATPGLSLERSITTELYRIDSFRRISGSEHPEPPHTEAMPLDAVLDPEVARHVVWGGAKARRAEVQTRETTARLPILMYHSVAERGPERLARYRVSPSMFAAQMRWLRARGYHSLTSPELLWHFQTGRPFPGRPVMLTFDDGLQDFNDFAWPILRSSDFIAENFIVTDLVGSTALWDGEDGRQQNLMDWDEIVALGRTGARFGSHLASHHYADGLTSRALVDEAVRSRAALEAHLGTEVLSLAAPFGALDPRFIRIAEMSGYKACFSTAPGFARLGETTMGLPRIEVRGDWDIEAFAGALESAS